MGEESSSSKDSYPCLSLEERVARLEGKIGWHERKTELSPRMFWISLLSLVVALGFCLKGLGTPNHYYQLMIATLGVMLAYHRGWLAPPRRAIEWILPVLNTAALTVVCKLFLGGGHRSPFFWLLYPVITKTSGKGSSSWIGFTPDWELTWQASSLAQWSFDLTIVQTFLLLITLIGALVEFQPFVSLTAFLLVIISLPVLLVFDWPWVFPGIVTVTIALYLQSSSASKQE